ncbi:MAG: PAS domain S-box protein, partial [Thermomicrobiales bacterium]|nr:PAS domain S-box protein [Thermomicrobiales bacterium]
MSATPPHESAAPAAPDTPGMAAAVSARPMMRSAAMRYGVAVGLVAIAVAITWGLRLWIAPASAPAFYAAVAVSAWFGGLGPSLVTTALSAIVLNLAFFDVLEGPPLLHPDDLPRLALFLLTALLVSALSASQRRAAVALWASEQRYRAMVETWHEGIWMLDGAGRTRYANDRMARLLGVDLATLNRASIFDFLNPREAEPARQRLDDALAGKTALFDCVFHRPDGGEVIVEAGLGPFRDDAGRITGASGMFVDITERRHAEAALERANERFELAAEAVQELIYEYDVATGLVYRNLGLLHITGYRPEDAPPTVEWWLSRVHPDDRAFAGIPLGTPPGANDHFSREFRVRHRDGRYRMVWDVGRIVRDATGAPVRIVGATMDITEREAAERTLQV